MQKQKQNKQNTDEKGNMTRAFIDLTQTAEQKKESKQVKKEKKDVQSKESAGQKQSAFERITKAGKPDRRFRGNKGTTDVAASGKPGKIRFTKTGKLDMRCKLSWFTQKKEAYNDRQNPENSASETEKGEQADEASDTEKDEKEGVSAGSKEKHREEMVRQKVPIKFTRAGKVDLRGRRPEDRAQLMREAQQLQLRGQVESGEPGCTQGEHEGEVVSKSQLTTGKAESTRSQAQHSPCLTAKQGSKREEDTAAESSVRVQTHTDQSASAKRSSPSQSILLGAAAQAQALMPVQLRVGVGLGSPRMRAFLRPSEPLSAHLTHSLQHSQPAVSSAMIEKETRHQGSDQETEEEEGDPVIL